MARLHGQIAALIPDFRPGYKIGKHNGHGHVEILAPDGSKVRTPSGQPVTLPMTHKLGGPHAIRRIRKHLIDAGVIAKPEEVAVMETVQPIKKYTPPPPVSPQPEDHRRAFDEWIGRQTPAELPQAVANITYDEFLAMEKAVELVMQKGPRAVKQFIPFVQMTQRVRRQLERRMEEQNGNGIGPHE